MGKEIGALTLEQQFQKVKFESMVENLSLAEARELLIKINTMMLYKEALVKDLLKEENFDEYKRMKELYTPSGLYIKL